MKITQLTEEKKLFENGNRLDFSEVVFSNSIIEIFGKNNHIFFASGSKISESKISIYGDNNAIYFGKSKSSPTKIILDIWHNSSCFFGGWFTAPIRVAASEHQNVIIGKDVLIGAETFVMTSDVHVLYDLDTKKRLNFPSSVFIGDHVWIARDCKVLKGVSIASGSIVGANTLVNKNIPSNTLFAGIPAKKVRSNVGYWGGSTHPWKQEDTERSSVKNTVADIDYQRFGGSFLKFEQYDKNLKACHSSQERIDYLKLMDTLSYDRFVARD